MQTQTIPLKDHLPPWTRKEKNGRPGVSRHARMINFNSAYQNVIEHVSIGAPFFSVLVTHIPEISLSSKPSRFALWTRTLRIIQMTSQCPPRRDWNCDSSIPKQAIMNDSAFWAKWVAACEFRGRHRGPDSGCLLQMEIASQKNPYIVQCPTPSRTCKTYCGIIIRDFVVHREIAKQEPISSEQTWS